MGKNNRNYTIRTGLEFRTNKAKKGKKRFTVGFFILIGIVMLACVCTLLLLKEYDFDIDNIIGRTPETTEDVSDEPMLTTVEGYSTFLLAISNDGGKKLHHAALVSFDVSTGDVKIYTVDVKQQHDTDKVDGTLSSLFSKSDGSMLRLKEAVEDVTGTEISRYIRTTDSAFKSIVKMFGGIPYNVTESVRYSCDGVGYIIEKGMQTLTADMSYKYMYYLSQEHADKPDEMSNFLAAILKTVLSEQNVEKSDSYYSRLVNLLDTDISAFDYSSNKSALLQLISLLEEKDIAVVDSVKEL